MNSKMEWSGDKKIKRWDLKASEQKHFSCVTVMGKRQKTNRLGWGQKKIILTCPFHFYPRSILSHAAHAKMQEKCRRKTKG